MCIQTEQLLSAGRSPSPRYHSLHQHSQPMHPRSSSHSRLPFDDRSPSPPRQRYGQHRYRNGESSLNLLEKWEVYVVVFFRISPNSRLSPNDCARADAPSAAAAATPLGCSSQTSTCGWFLRARPSRGLSLCAQSHLFWRFWQRWRVQKAWL